MRDNCDIIMAVTKELVSHWAQSYDCHCDPSSM